jgi:hypothetical protein
VAFSRRVFQSGIAHCRRPALDPADVMPVAVATSSLPWDAAHDQPAEGDPRRAALRTMTHHMATEDWHLSPYRDWFHILSGWQNVEEGNRKSMPRLKGSALGSAAWRQGMTRSSSVETRWLTSYVAT